MQALLLHCEYDSANRLVSVTNTTPTSTTTEAITYDAEDKRLKDTINSGQSTVAYQNTPDSDTQVSETLAGSDKGVRYTIEAPNGAQLWDYTGGTPRLTLTDHQSTVAAELNPTDGHVTNTQDYDVYGAPAPATVSALTTNTEAGRPTGYTGMREDVASATTHHQARDLSAEYRVWTSTDQYEDPVDDQDVSISAVDSNRSQYAGSNPVSRVDLDGHRTVVCGELAGTRDVWIFGYRRVFAWGLASCTKRMKQLSQYVCLERFNDYTSMLGYRQWCTGVDTVKNRRSNYTVKSRRCRKRDKDKYFRSHFYGSYWGAGIGDTYDFHSGRIRECNGE